MTYFAIPFANSGDKEAIPSTAEEGELSWQEGYPISYSVEESAPKYVKREQINWLFNKLTSDHNAIQDGTHELWGQDLEHELGDSMPNNNQDLILTSTVDNITNNSINYINISPLYIKDVSNIIERFFRNGDIMLFINNGLYPPLWESMNEGILISSKNEKTKKLFDVLKNSNYLDRKDEDYIRLKSFKDLFLKPAENIAQYEEDNFPEHNHDFTCEESGDHSHTVKDIDTRWTGSARGDESQSYTPAVSLYAKITNFKKVRHTHAIDKDDLIKGGEETKPKHVDFEARMFLYDKDKSFAEYLEDYVDEHK